MGPKVNVVETTHKHDGCSCESSHKHHYETKQTNQKYQYILEGLDCANCAAKIERHLNNIDIFNDVSIDFMKLSIRLNSSLSEKDLVNRLESEILKVEGGIKVVSTKRDKEEEKDYTIYRIVIALVLFFSGLFIPFESISISLILISYLLVGYDVLLLSVKNILKGKVFDENFLMSIATIGAIAIREYPEAAAVMLFYQVGEFFQRYAVRKSRRSISELMDIKPEFASVIRNGQVISTDPNDVKVDEVIVVKPGEKVPLDGVVIKGATDVDNKALTGESMLVTASIGSSIISGSINITGLIEIKVTKAYAESTVSKILDLVENASSNKAKSENFITSFSKYYTPIVVLLALVIAFVVPLFIEGQPFGMFFERGLSFLVVSCPCALVISIPLSYFAGIGGLSKQGILVKGSNYIEVLSKVDTVIFDKTGTLTKGEFNVVECSSDETLRLAAHSEYNSNHPIAKSIVKAYKGDIDTSIILDNKEIIGKGVEAIIDSTKVYIGNASLMKDKGIIFEEVNSLYSVLYVAKESEYVGYIIIADEIKEDSKQGISDLKAVGIKNTIMLTGDKKSIATEIANSLGIDKVEAELLPHQKVEQTKEYLKHGKVAFVGDGINDAPALALVDVGLAMGGIGSDAAIEAADIVLMNDKVTGIAKAIKGSKKIQGLAIQNIAFALIVKFAVLALISVGLVDMWMAVFADVGVSLIAIINSLRGMKL